MPSASRGPSVPALQPDPVPESLADSRWWSARFRFPWPPGEDPAWHLDALVAQQVIAPVLRTFAPEIGLWRFHRRAARDKTGHQLRFIFYATRKTAAEIFGTLKADARLQGLKGAGLLDRVRYSDTDTLGQPNIADTADGSWSKPVQRVWPYFIMGVSRMWLELIEDIAAGIDDGRVPDAPADQAAFFAKVDAEVTRTWQEEGRHALLHHLNALFGYGPLVVYEKRYLQF